MRWITLNLRDSCCQWASSLLYTLSGCNTRICYHFICWQSSEQLSVWARAYRQEVYSWLNKSKRCFRGLVLEHSSMPRCPREAWITITTPARREFHHLPRRWNSVHEKSPELNFPYHRGWFTFQSNNVTAAQPSPNWWGRWSRKIAQMRYHAEQNLNPPLFPEFGGS